MRQHFGKTIAVISAVAVLSSCSGESQDFFGAPCVPSLEFELTRELDGFVCPCRSFSTPESICHGSYRQQSGNESVELTIGGAYYEMTVHLHPDVEAGDRVQAHDISNLNYDERRDLADPQPDEAWVDLELPIFSEAEFCAEDISQGDYPDAVSDIEGSIEIEEYRAVPEEKYLNASLDLDSMVLATPDHRWSFAGTADIEIGEPPVDDPEGGSSPFGGGDDDTGGNSAGGGDVDCQQQCQHEHDLCEQNRMLGCYCGAACLCQCALDHAELTPEEREEYESCVQENRNSAEMVEDEEGHSLGGGTGSGDDHICDVL